MPVTMEYFSGAYVMLLVLSVLPDVAPRSNVCLNDGKKFLVVMPKVQPASDSKTHHLVIQGRPGAIVTVILPWNDTFEEKIPEDAQMTYHINHSRLNANFTDNAVQKVALYISCPFLFNVFVYSGDGYSAIQMPSGILRQDLRYHFVIASYKVEDGCKAFIAVAAIADNTLVNGTVRIKDGGKAYYGSLKLENGESFTNLQLGTLEVMFIWSENDLTGTAIVSSTYVSVFSGFDCTCRTAGGECHGIMTQIPPLRYLRHQYLPVQAFGFADDTIFRIIAIEPNTTIHKPSNRTFRTTLSLVGDFADMHSATQSPGVIRGDKPILVMSYVEKTGAASGCLSVMTLVRPGIKFDKTINVYAIPSVDTSILIIHKVSPSNRYPIVINDTVVDTLESYVAGPKYVALRTEIGSGPHVITSTNTSARIIVYVYGKGHRDFYSFIGACIGTDEEDEEEEEEEEEVSASPTTEALEHSTSAVQMPAASSLLQGSGNWAALVEPNNTYPGPSATLVSSSDPLMPSGRSVTSVPFDPATILARSVARDTLEHSEPSDKLAPSKTSGSFSLHTSEPTYIPAHSDPSFALVPSDPTVTLEPSDPSATLVHLDPTATLEPSDPSATLEPSDPSATLVHLDPTATLEPSDPSATLEPSDPTVTLELSDPSAALVHLDPTATLEPSDPSATLEPSDPTVTLEPSDPSVTLVHLDPTATLEPSDPTVTLEPSDPSAALVHLDPTSTLEPSDPSATLEPSDPTVTLEPSDPSATLVLSDTTATSVNPDPVTSVPSDSSATLVNSDPVTLVPSDSSATLTLSEPVTLSSPRRLCPCPGTSAKQSGSVHQSVLAVGRSKLTLYTKSLSSQIRKRVSSYDGRTSSMAFGYTGMVVVIAPLLIVFVCDARLFLLHIAGKMY